MAVRSELEGWQRIFLAQQEAAQMETPARVLSLPVEPRPDTASVLTRTLSGKRGHEGLMGKQGGEGAGVYGVLWYGPGRPADAPHALIAQRRVAWRSKSGG